MRSVYFTIFAIFIIYSLLLQQQCDCHLNSEFIQSIWTQFKNIHAKSYLSEEIENYRYDVFKQNLDLIEKHNLEHSMGLHTFMLGINHFADWTIDEFRTRLLGFRKNMTQTKDGSLYTMLRLPQNVQLPDSVDWREQGAVTPVKDQGQCGSCWSFSATGSLEGAHFRATGKLVSLSEQQLVDCSSKYGNSGCNGGLMDNAFKYVKENNGLDTEDSYSYHAHKSFRCHFKAENVGATCSGYVDVTSGDEEALKEAVATQGPISIGIDADNKFMFYKSGVFVDNKCKNKDNDLDHGVLLVGYGTDPNGGGEYWLVKNSWSSKWGEQGYIRMARGQNNMCGVATSASYPVVK